MKRSLLPLLAASIMLCSSVAEARAVTPLDGKAWLVTENSCFTNGWNQLSNTACTGYRKWLFGAPTDTQNNWHHGYLWGRGTGSTVVKCWVTSNTMDGLSGATWYAERSQSTWGEMTRTWTYFLVNENCQIHVDCDLPQTGGVSSFYYDP